MRGKGLTASTLRALLEASYSGESNPIGKWNEDEGLSTDTAHVYVNANGQVVVAHRGTEGTASDWGNNLKYASTGEIGYKQTDRFKESKAVQKAAEAKYGADKISTIGHSQGGLLAELLGKDSKEIITVNKATSPWSDNSGGSNQYDIRSDCDKVSMFKDPFKKERRNDTTIKGKRNWYGGCKDSVKEHSYDILKRRDDNEMFGDEEFTRDLDRKYNDQENLDYRIKSIMDMTGKTEEEARKVIQGGSTCMSKGSGASRCWSGYSPVPGKAPFSKGSCRRSFSSAGRLPVSAGLEGKGVSVYSKKKAKSLGVEIKPSTKKGKKIDVFKDDKLIASIGAKGYKDYAIHLAESGKEVADKRRKAYKMRHEKDRHTPGTPGFYADKILW